MSAADRPPRRAVEGSPSHTSPRLASAASLETTGEATAVLAPPRPGLATDLRCAGRSLGFVGVTMSLLTGLELARLRTQAEARPALTFAWMQRYGRVLLDLYGLAVSAEGPYTSGGRAYPTRDSRGRGRMFVMNHRSMLDVFVNLAFVEAHRLSRGDVASWPVIGLAARRVGTIFVDRTDRASGSAAVAAMAHALEQGHGVLVYPEGTTFAGDEVRRFRAGAFTAAARAGAEVIPLGIAYASDSASYTDETFGAHYRRIAGASRTRIGFAAGEPIEPVRDVSALTERAHAAVQERVLRARALIAPPAAQ